MNLSSNHTSLLKTISASVFALIAFAANSVLCRLALGTDAIDPASFTIIRLVSGAVTLITIIALVQQATSHNKTEQPKHSLPKVHVWLAPIMLFIYAITFSYAYTLLNTATGALILFGVVQLSMIIHSLLIGNKLSIQEGLGVLIAASGFIILMLPTAEKPSFIGFVLMTTAGLSWATYTLFGKKSQKPLFDTSQNFLLSLPFAVILSIVAFPMLSISLPGALLAIASGAIASGIGYAVWYVALANLSITQAAVSQLSVPAIAALGGVLFVSEPLTLHLAGSMMLVLSGIGLVIFSQKK